MKRRLERERLTREVDQASIDLEARNATLRDLEARLEEAREAHFAASDGVHAAQSELFTANAEVARLEAEIRHRRESRREYETRLRAADRGPRALAGTGRQAGERRRIRWQGLLALADERVEQGQLRLEVRARNACRWPRKDTLLRWRRSIASAPRWPRPNSACTSNRRIVGTRCVRCRGSPAAANVWQSNVRRCWFPMTSELADQAGGAGRVARAYCRGTRRISRRQQDELPTSGAAAAPRFWPTSSTRRGNVPRRKPAGWPCSNCSNGCRPTASSTTGCAGMACSTANRCGKPLQVEAGWEDAVEAVLRERLAALPAACRRRGVEQGPAGRKIDLLLPLGGVRPPALPADDLLLARIRCDRCGIVGDSGRLAWRGAQRSRSGGCAGAPHRPIGERLLRDPRR
jgi:chromosome segregation protein